MTFFSGGGYFLFMSTKDMGTVAAKKRLEKEKLQGRDDQTPGKEQMMMDTLQGKGPAWSSYKELREQTTAKRLKIAEENTVYAVSPEKQKKIQEQKLETYRAVDAK